MPATDQLRNDARALYLRGASVAEIADALDRSERTVVRWRREDRDAGVDWDRQRDERRRKDPYALLGKLEARRQSLVDAEMEPGHWADALHKLQRVIDSIRAEVGDVSTILGVLAGYAEHVRDHAEPEDLAAVRRTIDAYMLHLRRERS